MITARGATKIVVVTDEPEKYDAHSERDHSTYGVAIWFGAPENPLTLRGGADLQTILESVFAAALIALIVIDAREQLLPDAITFPLLLFAVLASAALGAFGRAPAFELGLSLLLPGAAAAFSPARAALIGGLLIALAVPLLEAVERIDPRLFDRYLDWEELSDEELADEDARSARIERLVRATMLAGLLAALAWAALQLGLGRAHAPLCQAAYDGLWRAFWGALVGGGAIWWMRAIYFFLRGAEGMGLGDVKMMCAIGAFLGGFGAFNVLLLASLLGAAYGIALAIRAKGGLKTALPFGVCLGIAAIALLLIR